MTRWPRYIALAGVTLVAASLMLHVVLGLSGVFNYDVWTREKPLVSPIAVTGVRDGTITLADGRVFRPAGVSRAESVSPEEYDKALRVIVAQGVVVIRDLGDGRAFLLAEPKFYNWCGARNMDGIPWKRWAGAYYQCPMSELLIHTGNATPALDQTGLTTRERWRLEGVQHVCRTQHSPTLISEKFDAFRFDASIFDVRDYDTTLQLMWKPPPSP